MSTRKFQIVSYKKILERQIMQNTPILDVIERFLNPVLGKSLSMYFKNTP